MQNSGEGGHLFAYEYAPSRMAKVQVVEMSDKCLRLLLGQLFQEGGVADASSRRFRNGVALLLEPFQVLLERLRSLQPRVPELSI